MKICIVGYGNLGKSVEKIALNCGKNELVGIFTKRSVCDVKSPYGTRVFSFDSLWQFQNKIDVAILCTGSATDTFEVGIECAKWFDTIDCFDTHAKMREYTTKIDQVAKQNNHLSFVGFGWDPGLCSLMRCMFDGLLDGNTYTFYGKGVSQGHSQAIRKIDGVKNAIQYTIPKEDIYNDVLSGKDIVINEKEKHVRECFVSVENNFDKTIIEDKIKNMPYYFDGYETIVHFVDEDELNKNHNKLSHNGVVIKNGNIFGGKHQMKFELKLDSNPDFTAKVILSYITALEKLKSIGESGVRTIFDLPIKHLFEKDVLELVETYL